MSSCHQQGSEQRTVDCLPDNLVDWSLEDWEFLVSEQRKWGFCKKP